MRRGGEGQPRGRRVGERREEEELNVTEERENVLENVEQTGSATERRSLGFMFSY